MPTQINQQHVIDEAIEVLRLEADSILKLSERVNHTFVRMVDAICSTRGQVIVGGIGKSGNIARKISATLNSTGTRSFFLHPVEAMHGDLGMVSPDDILIALSASGETGEMNILLPSIRKIGCTIVAFTGNAKSTLAHYSDIIIDVSVEREACPLGLTPTCSTTAMLAMGDALAVVLINCKQFKSDDFKKYHPGGALGQRLAGKVSDIMLTGKAIPSVHVSTPIPDALCEMNRHSIGVILIKDNRCILKGIITDGDIRRAVADEVPISTMKADMLMTQNPHHATPDTPAYDALNTMERYEITVLPITDKNGKIEGILHLHDILGKGEFKFNGNY
ncbi:MAG: KpsF/GutQ family sugar-phosphate isomerase [Desulfobacteraceae bacterium]|nr:KpsF/GutQ family sugar-phosphate isomerase [Desulfobacteraceae bacterium]